jgi:hypothetical protein
MSDPEFLSNPEKASKAESASVMVETINLALYGEEDPWHVDSIYGKHENGLPDIERGYQSYSTSKLTGEKILVKYDPNSRKVLLNGSYQPIHVASIVMGEDEYSIYAKTEAYHTDGYEDNEDGLNELFQLLEDNEGSEEIAVARALDYNELPNDFSVDVYKNLPRDSWFLKTMGKLGLEFAEIAFEGDERVSLIANAEGKLVESEQGEIVRNLEIATGVSTIDSFTARVLIQRLQDEFVPDHY